MVGAEINNNEAEAMVKDNAEIINVVEVSVVEAEEQYLNSFNNLLIGITEMILIRIFRSHLRYSEITHY